MNKETNLQNQIRVGIQDQIGSNIRTYRNNTGEAWQGKSSRTSLGHVVIENPQRVKYGLKKGSSDLIGIYQIEITPEMVGKKIGIFTAIEIKTEKGVVSKEQKDFINTINKLGGIAGTARSVEDAVGLINDYLKKITQ
jgi:hypothetical protein